MVEDLGIRLSSILALGASLTSAILMLVSPIFGAYFGSGVYVYVVAGAGSQGSLITVAAVLMIICSLIALTTVAIPERLNRYILIFGIVFPLTVFILGLTGLGIAYSEFSGYEWWPEAGFFGSVIPTLIAFLFFLYIFIKMRKQK